MNEPVDNGFTDDRVFKQFKPALGFDLGSDDERGFVVALLENIDERGRFLVGVVAQTQVIEDQHLGFDQAAHVVEITPGGLGGLDFFKQEVDRQKLDGMAS